MNVQDVMTRSPRTCRGNDSLVTAAKVLWDLDCGVVPVVDDAGRPIGVVTDRDCCMAAYTRGLRLDEIPVAAAMAKVVFTVRADAPVTAAIETMRGKQVRRLPVVDAQGKLCGIVSSADLVARAGKANLASPVLEMLAAIGAPRSTAASNTAASSTVASSTAATSREASAVVVPKAPAGVPTPVAPAKEPATATGSQASGSTSGSASRSDKDTPRGKKK